MYFFPQNPIIPFSMIWVGVGCLAWVILDYCIEIHLLNIYRDRKLNYSIIVISIIIGMFISLWTITIWLKGIINIQYNNNHAPITSTMPLPTYGLCSEFLGNFRDSELAQKDIEDFKNNPNDYKFFYSEYDKFILSNSFENNELTGQMENFYRNIKRVNPKFNEGDFKVMIHIGNKVKELMGLLYGCTDYFEGVTKSQAVSADTSINTRNVSSGVVVETFKPISFGIKEIENVDR